MQYWQYCTGTFSPRSPKFCSVYEGADELERAVADISGGRHRAVCWNDAADMDDFEFGKACMGAAFAAILPGRSSFETDGVGI